MEAARAAQAADLSEIARVAATATAEMHDQRGAALYLAREHAEPSTADAIGARLGLDDHHVVVGTIDGVVVGYAAGEIATLEGGDKLGVITDLHVLADARQVGVGEAMVDLLLEWFEAGSCIGVDAFALPGNRAAKNFFETSGFTARLLVMHRPTDAEHP